ncbi:hypothetical protein QBC42DRAFT_348864 [Cladorrhinum samala]|uniref:5'-3' DNA helicase ZGRF1-like N-terminal domain-containing protein n=1 Tax=Cladorrhinum samala TaxID=585594 RepID=A0AAV9HHS5_9PEZI|nr:hypothetical protein QBC42DRAFT_348864 [Cladorrhinum samala]
MPSFPSSGASLPRGQDAATGASSAPVLEFVCLFTHDLRRKQKRWQDGRLKYHTFNKRVMVYDDRGNFIGDMHWTRDYDFDEGEEVQLERGGVIVQVSECVGRQNQDLSELLDKRAKEKEQRQQRTLARPTAAAQAATRTPIATPRVRLDQSIGAPTGHYGRALVPAGSPFERRQQQANESPESRDDSRATKRRKYDETPPSRMGYAQALFGAPLTLSAVPMSSAPSRKPPASSTNRIQPERPTSLMGDLGKQSSPDEPEEIPPSLAVRAGLSKANMIAPLLRARPEPREAASERNRNEVERVTGKGGLNRTQLGSRPVNAAGPKPQKAYQGRVIPHTASTATKRPGPSPETANPQPLSLVSAVETAPKSRRGLVEGDQRSAPRTQIRLPRSKSIVSDDGTCDDADDAGCDSKVQEVVSNISRSKQRIAAAPRRPVLEEPTSRLDHVEKETKSPPEPPQEPRVELRMKPRQKRGLLMLSDHGAKPKRSKVRHEARKVLDPPPTSPEPKETVSAGKLAAANFQDSVAVPATGNDDGIVLISSDTSNNIAASGREAPMCGTASDLPNPLDSMAAGRPKTPETVYNLLGGTDAEFVTRLPPRQNSKVVQERANASFSRPQSAKEARKTVADSTELGPVTRSSVIKTHELSENEVPARRLRKRRTLPVEESDSEEEEEDEEELPQVPVGPRLARLGRKSVKSREVIGFVPSSSPVPGPTINVGFVSHPVSSYDQDSPSEAEESRAPPNKISESPASTTDEESLEACFVIRADARQPSRAPIKDADKLTAADEPSSEAVRGGASIKKLGAVPQLASENRNNNNNNDTINTIITQRSNSLWGPLKSPNAVGAPTDARGVAPACQSVRSDLRHAGEADLGYAGTAANLQNVAAREKDSAPKTMGPVADTGAAVAAVTTTTLQSRSHKNEELGNLHENATIISAPTKPPAQQSSAGSSRPRIANPATRGRKAALKSDAAGQVPRSILPPPELGPPARMNIRAPEAPRPDVTANERPKRVMRFPGFTTAKVGGGPWSREADDLLETGRPCRDWT